MKVIQISRLDNVAVALHPIKKGEEVTAGGITVTALEDIPQGHKIALKPIKNGENIVKYGSVSYTHLTLPTKHAV